VDLLRNAGALALGSRFRRLSDQLMQDGILVYRDASLDFEPKWFPVYLYLQQAGPSAVTDIARGLGITHPSVNQVAKEMISSGLVAAYKDTSDKRKRVLALTSIGKAKLAELEPVWSDIRGALQELVDETGVDFLGQMEAVETALDRKSFHRRFMERHERTPKSVEIVTYSSDLADDFRRLNEDWITEYFAMEAADRKTLDDPEGAIISCGGEIVFARDLVSREVLGTCALVRRDDALCELAKMAVVKSARGSGLGKLIGEAAVEVAREMGFMKVYLETNARLAPALGLYRRLGFRRKEFPYDSDYTRANIYMELVL
jgi:DNA-binding MarR family transcriptional regulator/GNAT superfamily N-acetyltransferase